MLVEGNCLLGDDCDGNATIEDNTISGAGNASGNGNSVFNDGNANIEDNFISGEGNASLNGNSVFLDGSGSTIRRRHRRQRNPSRRTASGIRSAASVDKRPASYRGRKAHAALLGGLVPRKRNAMRRPATKPPIWAI